MKTSLRVATLIALSAVAVPLHAQSLQVNSIQASGTALLQTAGFMPGGEVQYRRTFNEWSLGGGLQAFYNTHVACESITHCHSTQTVFFAEPRYVASTFDKDRRALYFAGRLGWSGAFNSSGGVVAGGGLGVLSQLTKTAGLDLGLQLYTSGGSSASAVTQFRAGLSMGY